MGADRRSVLMRAFFDIRKRDLVFVFMLVSSVAIAFWHGITAQSAGTTAQTTKSFISSLGAVTKLTFAGEPYQNATATLSALQYLGITAVRDFWLNPSSLGQASYPILAAGGIRFDLLFNYGVENCSISAPTEMPTYIGYLDTFVASYPGSIIYVEGQNEINNFPVCYFLTQATNAATSAGTGPMPGVNDTLHFASVPASLAAVTSPNFQTFGSGVTNGGAGMFVTDPSSPGPIDPGLSQPPEIVGTSAAVSITINSANEVLIADCLENGGPLTTVTDTLGLTWHQRASQVATYSSTAFNEEWYAIGPSSGSFPQADTVTLTQTSSSQMIVTVFGVLDANVSSPFDGSAVTGQSDPLTISTTNAHTLVLGLFQTNQLSPTAGAGWTQLIGNSHQLIEYQQFATSQTGLSVTVGTGAGTGQALIADALVLTSTPPGPAIPTNTTLWNVTSTTATITANALDGGVSNGDIIQFSTNGPTTAAAGAIAWQQDIYNGVHGDTNLSSVKVLNFTDFPNQGVYGSADYLVDHPYPGGGYQPFYRFVNSFADASQIKLGGTTAEVITEDGYYTPGDSSNGVDQFTQAIGTLNIYLDSFFGHNPNTFIYQLLDDNVSCTSGCWGLFDGSFNPKTAATAVHNLTTILADSGGAFTPGVLNYSVSGLPQPMQPWTTNNPNTLNNGGWSFLLEKSNGHFFIPVWNEPPIWNSSTISEITVQPITVVVSLGQTCSTVNVYDPMVGTSPVTTASSANSATLSLGADPQIVECAP